jgi:hypothetical protein
MRPDGQLLSAVARAEEAARSTYAFNAGSYAFDLLAAVAGVRAALDAPDWILEFKQWMEKRSHDTDI